MVSRFRDKLGAAGLVVAVVALVAALAGGAYAASGALTGKQKKEVATIAKKYAGKRGPKGATGPAGLAGTPGAAGIPGAEGKPGPAGAAGAAGKSVTLGAETPGVNCAEGGTKVEVEGTPASKRYICNGQEGSPWTAGGTLPAGETETGSWGDFTLTAGVSASSISFPIPLAEDPEVVAIKEGQAGVEQAAKCPGFDTEGTPQAAAGVLCIYASNEEGGNVSNYFDPSKKEAQGASPAGVVLLLETNGTGPVFGSWAVTAE